MNPCFDVQTLAMFVLGCLVFHLYRAEIRTRAFIYIYLLLPLLQNYFSPEQNFYQKITKITNLIKFFSGENHRFRVVLVEISHLKLHPRDAKFFSLVDLCFRTLKAKYRYAREFFSVGFTAAGGFMNIRHHAFLMRLDSFRHRLEYARP
ncbi:MAG: hypothetical protein U5M23_12985 [Marinagarivorans sp.]|nr:hypothetical protein [Marinagarivorans sp.]